MRQHIRGLAFALLRTESNAAASSTFLRPAGGVALLLRTNTHRNIPTHPFTTHSATASSTAMEKLQPLDRLSVTVIVDNESDTMSRGITGIEGFEYFPQKKIGPPYKDPALCSAGHGLSLLLEAQVGNKVQTLLMDAGPSPNLFEKNVETLGIDPGKIDAVVLSHYHWDHSGGLGGVVPLVSRVRPTQHPQLLVDLQCDEIISRGRPLPDGSVRPHQPDSPTEIELTSLGALVELNQQEHTLGQDLFYVSGYIPRLNDYETGIPGHRTLRHGQWEPDKEIADERYVACRVKNRGLVVFSACSHAGINNVCRDAMQRASGEHLFAVMGGFHLAGEQVEGRISRTITELKELEPSVVLAGHCTGWRAKAQLATDFGESFQPISVGCTYRFTSGDLAALLLLLP